jgi:hypothetical protein
MLRVHERVHAAVLCARCKGGINGEAERWPTAVRFSGCGEMVALMKTRSDTSYVKGERRYERGSELLWGCCVVVAVWRASLLTWGDLKSGVEICHENETRRGGWCREERQPVTIVTQVTYQVMCDTTVTACGPLRSRVCSLSMSHNLIQLLSSCLSLISHVLSHGQILDCAVIVYYPPTP